MKIQRLTSATARVSGLVALMTVFGAAPAFAYVGPGLGLAAIGAILGAIAAFFLAIAGLVWYPVKIMLKKRKAEKIAPAGEAPASAPASASATAANPETPDSTA